MSYQVLARKYRPQAFGEVLGQEHVTQTLQNALKAKRIHHAYLFTGARGIGKTTIARILAKALNCEEGNLEEPCGTCRSCQEITSGSSLDVQEIDGASNTGVDDVREIRDRVNFLPSSGKYKIYIIDEVHMLSTSAFNALLKTLEEPPSHVVFIFATTEVHKIPATILSRCQRYDFRRIATPVMVTALQSIAQREKIEVTDDALHLIAKEAGGSMRDAESLLDQAIASSEGNVTSEMLKGMLGLFDRKRLFDLLNAVFEKKPQTVLEQLEQVFHEGSDLGRFGIDFLELLRHLLVLHECGASSSLIDLPKEELQALEALSQKTSREELQQMFQIWYVGAEQVSRSHLPKILLEVLLLRLCRVEKVTPIGELMARVDVLLEHGTDQQRPSQQSPQSQQEDWPSLQRWLAVNEPRIASLFQHGNLKELASDRLALQFDQQLYADMLLEVERKQQIEKILTSFFHRPVRLEITCNTQCQPKGAELAKHRQQVTSAALESPIVNDAAEIFGATVYDVKPLSPGGVK